MKSLMRKGLVGLLAGMCGVGALAAGDGSVGTWPTYCVIDLSAGANAASYPVTYLDAAPSGGFNATAYKTTKLVLKRVAAGSFKMQNYKTVTLTKPFYMGLFEVTQKQWTLVMGSNPSQFKGDARPVEKVSYDMIRGASQGAKWPASNAVDASSFLGKLRARTSVVFDLPTEAQWEYACRAGTTTTYSYGDVANGDYMWYAENASSQTHDVGTKKANPWGFYDLHGNVWEKCLDWRGDVRDLTYGSDPKGISSGEKRVLRGGGYANDKTGCTSSNRGVAPVEYAWQTHGFRLVANSSPVVSGVSWRSVSAASPVTGAIQVDYVPEDGRHAVVSVDGKAVVDSTSCGSFWWWPQKMGKVTLTHSGWGGAFTETYNVTSLGYWVQGAPNPPMAKVSSIAITPVTREIPQTGGGAAIVTSGSGSWTASVSDDWISLNATSGAAGKPVAYVVGANADVEDRVGYVYVAGHVHTVTQKGLGAEVSKTNIEVERDGGTGTVMVTPTDTRSSWKARPNCDWISVYPRDGTGPSAVTYRVAPWHEVSTRSGTFTVGGHTVTVFQYGSRMALDAYSATRDYYAHVIPIKVDALAVTTWGVKPNASWISVVDAGNGQGGDAVSVAISENPSYKARTGTVTIGTETFTVTQEGRTALAFAISPAQTSAAVSGANGLVSVTATPDLPWTAASGANWITVLANFQKGAGNGNVVYTVSPQSTLYARTGTVTVTPEAVSGMLAKTHTVRQAAATSALSATGHEFAAAGETATVEVTVNDIVEWKVEGLPDWITLSGSASRVGPGTVTLAASANETVYPRNATVKIAEKAFKVSQRARGVEVEYDNKLFGTDGGMESISIHPDGNVAWKAVASADWIVIYQNDSGTGDAEILYIVAPYAGDGSPRTGTITVGDKVIYITQRAYDLDITPKGDWVTGNAGAGEIGVSASVGDVWSAIVTEPWITIVTGYDAGTGSGTVRFTYTDNDTGKTRTGKILVAGEAYTLTQAARVLVAVAADVAGGGRVAGAGSYTLGETATLEAIPDDGYEFLYWTGDAGETMQNPLTVTADVAKRVTAHFGPLTPEFTQVDCSVEGVKLQWRNLAWATEYRIYRAPTSEFPSEALATLVADGSCVFLDTTGTVGQTYFYWVEAVGAADRTESKDAVSGMKEKPIVHSAVTYTNLKGAENPNPATYEEGKGLAFAAPGTVTGYTFTGWTPAQITAEMTGAQTVTANWTANAYRIVYGANGGTGETGPTDCEYDAEGEIAANGFVRAGYVFKGWATEEGGEVVYAPGTKVKNLTSNAGGVVRLYAVWEAENVADPVISPADGTVFKTMTCMVTISCATEDVDIYCSTNGRTPRPTESNRYKGPFAVSGTTTVLAYAVKGEKESELVEATLTYVEPEPLTLETALDEKKLAQITTGGDAEWTPLEDATAKVGESLVKSGAVGMEQSTWLEATVYGKGTLTFWWKVSCEPDPRGRYTYDHITFTADGEDKSRLDGEKGWEQVSVTFTTDGAHMLRWTYSTDDWEEEGYQDCAWVDGVVWTGDAAPVEPAKPSVVGDGGASVTGDAEAGFVVRPSAGTATVVVEIPDGIDAAKVRVEVAPDVKTVTPNGAAVRVVRGDADITDFLDIPAAAGGVIDLGAATVKPEVEKEALDPAQGAVVDLSASDPQLTTSPTKTGLVYRLKEGATLEAMEANTTGDSTVGDGQPWTPNVTVKGGASGFYSIRVSK